MAFDKLIISSITNSAKSGIKMDLAVDSLKEKLIDTISTKVEDEIPVTLPFDVRSALIDGNLPQPTPELLSQVQPIPDSQKQQISNTLDSIEASLNSVITTKNSLQGSLSTITAPLTTVESLASTIGSVVTGLKVTVTVIKLIPIPTSVPPGIGIPVNVINGFSDALDTLKDVLDKFDGPLKVIPQAISQINNILIPIVSKLNALDPIFEKIIKIIAFIRTLLLFGPNATQQELDSVLASTASSTQQSLAATGVSTSPAQNTLLDDALISQLTPGTNNPLSYRGFLLTIEFDPDNKFNFPSRRIKGVGKSSQVQNVTIYNLPDNDYSFSSSTSVLVEEIKFRIDGYISYLQSTGVIFEESTQLSSNSNSVVSGLSPFPPFGEPGRVLYEVRRIGNDFYQFQPTALSGNSNSFETLQEGVWVGFTPDPSPFTTVGGKDGEERIDFKIGYKNIYKWNNRFLSTSKETPPAWEFDRVEY